MTEGITPPEEKQASKEAPIAKDNDRTSKEWHIALREMVAAHQRSTGEGKDEDWKERYFAERSDELDKKAQKFGLEDVFRLLGEKYNKLSWKSKLAVGLGLGVGTALFSSASLPAAIACMSGIAIQRTAGMASMFLKFEKNSHEEKWAKEKAMGKAVLYTAGMTAGMLLLVASIKESIDFAHQNNWGNATQEWLKQHWPFGEADVSPSPKQVSPGTVSPSAPDTSATELAEARVATDRALANVKQTLDEAQKLASEQQIAIEKAVNDYGNDSSPIENETIPSEAEGLEELKAEVNADLDAHQELNDALNKIEADKFGIKQYVAEHDSALDRYNAFNDLTGKADALKEVATTKLAEAKALQAKIDQYELQDSQIDGARETIRKLQEEAATAMAQSKDSYQQAVAQHTEAEISLSAETAIGGQKIDDFNVRLAELDIKIENALMRRNAFLDEYGAAGREVIESNKIVNRLYADATNAFNNAREHMEKYRDIIKNTNDSGLDAEEVQMRADIRGDQEVLDRDAENAAKAYDDAEAIFEDKIKRAESIKSQAKEAENAYKDSAAQKTAALEALNAGKPLESVLPASPAEQQGGGGDIISGAEQTNKTPEAQFGRDANGHPFPSEQEAKDYADLKKAIRDPRETGAWPPGPQKEKGLFEEFSDWFNRNQDENATPSGTKFETNAAGLAIDTATANIYLDAQGNHIIFGGSLEERAQKALELVAKDHSTVAYFDSTRPGGLLGWFQEHHLSKAYWSGGPGGTESQQPMIVDDVTDTTLRGVHLPSIDDLKEVYKPTK